MFKIKNSSEQGAKLMHCFRKTSACVINLLLLVIVKQMQYF
jgi:hypothetical protein